jgi:predicted phosphatase
MHFSFNNQFIKVKRTLAKISKTRKILLCLSFSIRGTTLHVICILDIKFFFLYARTIRFYPIKIRTSLQRMAFLKSQIDRTNN